MAPIDFNLTWAMADETGDLESEVGKIPDELWLEIFSLLGSERELAGVGEVCRRWYRMSIDPSLWTGPLEKRLPDWADVIRFGDCNLRQISSRLHNFCTKNKYLPNWQPFPQPKGFNQRPHSYRWAKISRQDLLVGCVATSRVDRSAICLWALPSRKLLACWELSSESYLDLLRLLPINHDRMLITAAGARAIYVWDLSLTKQRRLRILFPNDVRNLLPVQVNGNWRLLVSCGEEIQIWDPATGALDPELDSLDSACLFSSGEPTSHVKGAGLQSSLLKCNSAARVAVSIDRSPRERLKLSCSDFHLDYSGEGELLSSQGLTILRMERQLEMALLE